MSQADSDDEERTAKLAPQLQALLRAHGHGFSYAVIRYINEREHDSSCKWKVRVAEFPVSAAHIDTRIDFVMQSKSGELYLAAECKRANPALATWVFARAPFVSWRSSSRDNLVAQRLSISRNHISTASSWNPDSYSTPVYHLGFEMRTDQKGDPMARGHGAINEAVTQVLRGQSGLVDWFVANPATVRREAMGFGRDVVDGPDSGTPPLAVIFMAVIFTTARIWVCDVDLSSTDLVTGNITLPDGALKPKPWVFLNVPMSPSMRPGLELPPARDMASALINDYTRTICVVSSTGLDDFLAWHPVSG
jgi:hypothetical protein